VLALRARLLTCVAVAASGLALGLYARIEPWTVVLGWVGLVPWLAALDRVTSLAGTLGLGLLMSVAFVAIVFGWFAGAIAAYTGAPPVLAWVLLLLGAPLVQPQLLSFALARQVARARAGGVWRVAIAGACVYVGTEWAFPKLFRDTLGYGLHASVWMRQAADLGGASVLTLVLVLANECGLALLRAVTAGTPVRARLWQALAPASGVAALALALLLYGAIRVQQLAGDRSVDAITAGVVQPDISHYDRLATELGTFGAVRRILDTHFALSAATLARGDLDLLVWPETTSPTTFGSPKSEDGAALDLEIAAFVTAARIPLVFGAYDVEAGQEFNAAVLLEPAASGPLAFETYRKTALFPLTEWVPPLLDSPRVRAWLPWLGAWRPGTGPQVLALTMPDGRRLRIGPLICYDALDPRLAAAAVRGGADLLVTLSNDSWFDVGPGPRLHLVGAAFRSIETRRPQLRATSTGISAAITATGELRATAAVHARTVLVATVTPERRATTLALAWGDWLGPSALALGAALLLAPARAAPRRAAALRKAST
jgi:apolipoprotein N-acyltransferase